jgi:hypothetical protein
MGVSVKLVVDQKYGFYLDDINNLKVLKVINCSSTYYDGVEIVRGKKAKVYVIGAGDGCIEHSGTAENRKKFKCFIDVSKFDLMVKELLEIYSIDDDIDKYSALKDFVDDIFDKFLGD